DIERGYQDIFFKENLEEISTEQQPSTDQTESSESVANPVYPEDRRKKRIREGSFGSSPGIPIDLSAEVKESPPPSPPHSIPSHSVPPSSQQPSANPADNLSKFLAATSFLREAFDKLGDVITHVDRLEEIIKFALHMIHELEKKMKTDEDPAQPV
ncbi:hypothetical protein U1Q18_010460, partial [Sarracenia purpurea var. burkii]